MLNEIKEMLMKGDRSAVERLTKRAVDEGLPIRQILEEGLIAGMEVIGGRFKRNEIFIPEVLIAAKAMHTGVAILEPHFAKSGIMPVGRVVIGTVKGDLHDIGKNIVSMMLKGGCFEMYDLGIDVAPEKFAAAVKSARADILAMSSLLTTSMGSMRDTINFLKGAGLRDTVKVIVGGAPVTQDFADAIGADAYAKDAASAVDCVRALVQEAGSGGKARR